MVTAVALHILLYRRAKNGNMMTEHLSTYATKMNYGYMKKNINEPAHAIMVFIP